MLSSVYVIALVVVCFVAMIIQLAAKPAFSAKLTGTLTVIAAISGFFFYGYGFSFLEDDFVVAVIRGLLGVFYMFLGRTDFSMVSATPLKDVALAAPLFWLAHLAAFYATASATITTIGAEALKKLRLWLVRRGDLYIIYGVNPDSVGFAKELAAQTHGAVVFVDPSPDSSCAGVIQKSYVLRTDGAATSADEKFAKRIGLRAAHRKVTLYALSKDPMSNLSYADRLLKTMEKLGVAPERTSLVILGTQDGRATSLQTLGSRYGYGFVTVFQEAELAARLLIHKYPPCAQIRFDGQGRAEENFEALIIGFGQIGQAVLRSLVMNGQFVGSTFRCNVFAPNCTEVSGFLTSTCRELLSHYDIQFHACDARSSRMYEFLANNAGMLKYVVVCTGNDGLNREITSDLLQYFQLMGCDIPVYQCARRGIQRSTNTALFSEKTSLYTPEMLRYEKIDRMAMSVNQYYHAGSEKTALENWMECDYFSRMSSRAAADFFPAVLRCAGTEEEQVLKQGFRPDGALLETLGQMEHLRWCAFHHCMGYTCMDAEEYSRRAENYRAQLNRGEKPTIRIGKNTVAKTHACLIPWEELDALSERENAITGGSVNYQDLDIQNVLAIEPILRSCEETEGA